MEYPEETLLGEYQLEIRRGTEYLVQPNQTLQVMFSVRQVQA